MTSAPGTITTVIDLEELLSKCLGTRPILGLGIRRLAKSPVDVRLFFPNQKELQGAAGDAILAQLQSSVSVESARRKGGVMSVRLSASFVEAVGRQLEGDADGYLATSDALAGRSHVVNFLNPNATKPLHIGHLRNVSIGMALAASLEACGSRVTRQCYVCDIGRNVCEAMAGYERFHAGETPPTGTAPDQFVGRCYAQFVGLTAGDAPPSGADDLDPVSREGAMAHDRADELLLAWAKGDPEIRALWSRVRDWALDGQAATLQRLGVRWDRVHYESESITTVRDFVDRGLQRGLFTRGEGDEVIYETGRSEYATLKLTRADGFPTEHARVIGLFLREQADLADIDGWLVVCGDEWDTAGQVELEIAERLGAESLTGKVDVQAHGMVTVAGSKMKSRDGQAILIDEFLDDLAASDAVRQLSAESGGRVAPEQLVDLLVKGFFLSRKPSKSLEFCREAFLDELRNPAWIVARAWSRASRAAGGEFDAERYRTAVMQTFQFRQLLARSVDGFQGTSLMKFVNGLSEWYLEGPSDVRLDGVVRSILAQCARSLGIGLAR